MPGSEKLIGVVAEAAAPGSGDPERIVVATEARLYTYTWTGGASPSLSTPVESTVAPEGQHVLDVYQAPPGKGEYNATGFSASSSFAIAYTSAPGRSFTVEFDAYSEGSLKQIYTVSGPFPSGETGPLEVRYAIADNHLHAATLTRSTTSPAGAETMTQYNYIAPNGFLYSESEAGASPTVSNCPPSATGELGVLAADAVAKESFGGNPGVYSGGSLCAGVVEGKVLYILQRDDQGGALLGSKAMEETLVRSTSKVGSFNAPAGGTIEAIDGTLDFPCDEYLSQFAAHPTPDGYPDTSTEAAYCGPVTEEGGATFTDGAPYEPRVGAAGMAAAQIQYISEEGGVQTLRQHSLSFEPEAHVEPPFGELRTVPKSVYGEYDERLTSESQLAEGEQRKHEELPRISRASTPSLDMLALDPAETAWSGELVLNAKEEVLKAPGTSSPVPIAVMAAPPYYAGAEQQVTPTATTFSNGSCEGAGSEQSNTAGVFAGVDYDPEEEIYEFEALAKIEASWTQGTEEESCHNFDQEFIAGNFSNNYLAENSLLFRVDTGTDTYMDLTKNTLGVGVTSGCDADHLSQCDPLFDPESSQYALQTVSQLRHPQPNDFYAADDERLNVQYGPALEATLPKPGNPSSYPAPSSAPGNCAPDEPSGSGSGNAGIVDVNPFVAPTPEPAPNLLEASQASEVNPASGGDEAGTSSTLHYDESKETSSSAEFSIGAEVSAKIAYAKFGAEYSHAWGTDITQSFQTGTEFSGGVFDFNGFYNPYSYRLYECKSELKTSSGFEGGPSSKLPVFLIDYTTAESADGLPLNFVTPSLPEVTAGQEYGGQVFVSGGVPGYEYRIVGGELPPGVSLNETSGQIGGTPSTEGTYEFTVQGQDTAGNRATQKDSITVNPPLSIENPLPDGTVGVPYEHSLGAGGGVSPYTYLLTSYGEVPPGLGINNTTGALEGTPTKLGTYCFGVYIADSEFPKATLDTSTCVTIGDSLTLSPSSLPAAVDGQTYEVNVTGAGGNTGGYTYATAEPARASCETGYTCQATPPAGLSLDQSGSTATITGTPTAEGKYEFAIQLSDGVGGFVERDYELTVESAVAGLGVAPAFTSLDAATVTAGSAEAIEIQATGTPAPVITLAGALPAGMSFSEGAGGTAEISGMPGAGSTGVYTLTLAAQNGVSPNATQTFTLTVDSGPSITTQPADQTTTAPGGAATFTAAATGTPTPTVQWEVSLDGGSSWAPISGETSPTLSLTGLEAGENGREYRAVFTNTRGSVTSSATTDAAKLTVDHAPELVTQPSSDTVDAGEDATFTAAAGGEPAPAAQWQVSSDGGVTWTNIAGATASSLTLHGVSAGDNANEYRVVFTNPVGAVTSAAAQLTVQTGPVIAQQPADQTIDAGGEATFTASATGNPAPSVQWQVSSDGGATWSDLSAGGDVSGASAPTLTLTGVTAGEDGNEYRAVFSNGAGSQTSAAAKLTVQTGPVIAQQPADQTIDAGGEATFTAAASGNPAPSVQWQVSNDDGITWSDVSGATSPTLTLTDVPAVRDGYEYRAMFANTVGSMATQPAMLTVQTGPALSEQPANDTIDAGAQATFTASATGNPAPSVQWEVSTDGGGTWRAATGGGSSAGGATAKTSTAVSGSGLSSIATATLTLTGVPAAQNGYEYRAVFANAVAVAGVDSAPATLTVQTAPTVTAQPSDQMTPEDGAATFSAAAGGLPAPSIQWQVSADGGSTWTNVTGAGAPSLTLANVPARDNGQLYRAVFANAAGAVTSAAASLTVLSPPSVLTPPTGETVVPGGGVVFTIAVSGNPAPSLQWQVSENDGQTWANIPGATSASLSLTHVSAGENGYLYRVLIVNSQGSTTSQPVTLFVSRQAVAAATSCRPAPTKLAYPRRRLGPVVRYRVYVDGHLRHTVHGRDLRSAELPTMTAARHTIKIVSTTSRGYRLTTTRVYTDCTEMVKHVKAKRPHGESSHR